MIDPGGSEVRAAFNGAPYVAQHAWQTNAAGHDFHNWYGFGAVDVDAAVALASAIRPAAWGRSSNRRGSRPARTRRCLCLSRTWTARAWARPWRWRACPEGADIEAVVLGNRSPTPQRVRSRRHPALARRHVQRRQSAFNSVLAGFPGLQNWQLLSNAFYGENPNGADVQLAGPRRGGHRQPDRLAAAIYYGEHP